MRNRRTRNTLLQTSLGILAAAAVATAGSALAHGVVHEAQQSEGLIVEVLPNSSHTLVSLEGLGSFVAARVVKQGGDTDLTAVRLFIDGRQVVSRNIAALHNWQLTEQNPFGVVVFSSGDLDTVTIGFPQVLRYHQSLELVVDVGEDDGVVQIIGTVIHGR